jgi:hypothetical protein
MLLFPVHCTGDGPVSTLVSATLERATTFCCFGIQPSNPATNVPNSAGIIVIDDNGNLLPKDAECINFCLPKRSAARKLWLTKKRGKEIECDSYKPFHIVPTEFNKPSFLHRMKG